MPDPNTIVVRPDLESAGPYLNARALEITTELDALRTYINSLGFDWTGAASGLYQDAQNRWNIAAAGLFGPAGVLGAISHAMNVTWGNYVEAEDSNGRTWRH